MHGADRQNFAYRYRTDNHGKGSWYSINGNIDYQRTSRKNKERMITLSYKINSQPQTNDSYNTYLDIEPDENKLDIIKELSLKNFHSDGKTNTMEQTFQVDYTTPIESCIQLKPVPNIFSDVTPVIIGFMKPREQVKTMHIMRIVVASTVI